MNNRSYVQMRTYNKDDGASKKCAIVFILVFEAFSLLLKGLVAWLGRLGWMKFHRRMRGEEKLCRLVADVAEAPTVHFLDWLD